MIDTSSRTFRQLFDASTNGLETTLEQEQSVNSIRPILYTNRATLDNKRNMTPTELQAGCIMWTICSLRPYLFNVFFIVHADGESLEQIIKINESNPRIERWMEIILTYIFRL